MNQVKPTSDSLKEYARGVAGGLLFSLPLLYTMEMWWAGFIASPFSLLLLVGVTFFLLLGYNRYGGLRPDLTWREVMIDSVEELGLGLVISFAMLLMLNRINPGDMSVEEMIGKVVVEAMTVSIGVSIGTNQLGAGKGGGKDDQSNGKADRSSKVGLVVMAMCGGLVVGSNVAPTQEILVIAVEAEPAHILTMCLVSLTLSVIIAFFSDFKGTPGSRPDNFTYHLLFDTTVCYVAALAISAFVLWFFGAFNNMGWWISFSEVIVLGVLSSLGASAGRLLIK